MIDFSSACREFGGVETKQGFEFSTATAALKVANLEAPPAIAHRVCTAERKFDRLIFQVRGDEVCGWSRTVKRGYLTLIVPVDPEPIESVRAVSIQCGDVRRQEGWYVKERSGQWCYRSPAEVSYALMALLGVSKTDAQRIMGGMIRDPWVRECTPFALEYPGEKRWNRGAPQLAFEPTPGAHPHWDKLFAQVGRKLKLPAKLREVGLRSGGQYLRAWLACILRDPACRLPYLFLYGDENCGKSMFWEAFALLVTCGVVKADRALTTEYNGELDGAILCAVEEKDISGAPGVKERIKDVVTGNVLAIRRMFTDQYQVPNYTHFVQTANSKGACLIPPGDTRFVVIRVGKLRHDIPKPELIEKLKAEAPAILHTMLTMQLPEPTGRLALPTIDTPDKLTIQEQHLPPLAHAVSDFMATRRDWSGTAAQLREHLGEGPKTIAKLRATIENFAPYLALHGIVATFPETRTNQGYIMELRKQCNA